MEQAATFSSKKKLQDGNTATTMGITNDDGEMSSTSESELKAQAAATMRTAADYSRNKYKLTALIFLLGSAVSAAFIAMGVLNAKRSADQSFYQRTVEITSHVESSWNVYKMMARWIRESCQKPFEYDDGSLLNTSAALEELELGDDPSHALGFCNHKEFDKIFDYVVREGVTFQAINYLPNITHAQRPYLEAYGEIYYETNFPGRVNFRGITQYEPNPEPGRPHFEPSEKRDFYFPYFHTLPLASNEAAVFFDPYSRHYSNPYIDKAVETWEPVLSERVKLIQEKDAEAYSVILYHPGVRSRHEAKNLLKSTAIAQIIVRVPDLLVRFTRGMQAGEELYLYDSTLAETPPVFLGAARVISARWGQSNFAITEPISEIEFANIHRPSRSHSKEREIEAADRTWTLVIVSTNEQPNLIFVIVGGIFIFLACVVIAIWYYRHMTVMEKMVTTQNLLSSVFPKAVQDRLMKDALEAAAGNQGGGFSSKNGSGGELKEFLGKEGSHDIMPLPKTKPIADLVLDATVLFADIAGFTAWSSTREPAQVFTLLENVFHTFDTLAKRRRVYKVETVGDCYVAVTGLPEPRKDHAVAMVRFAKDCLNSFQVLCRQLEVDLGPDTADLGIRVGIHSGPVTSGVLRGERPRFQLFGDTMNTASRIESTGQKNRIQLSQESADMIVAAGKQHWLVPRRDKVLAKGLGALQTFWCDGKTEENKSMQSRSSGSSGQSASGEAVPGSMPLKETLVDLRVQRLVNWNTSVLLKFLKSIVARRRAARTKPDNERILRALEAKPQTSSSKTVFDEAVDVIELPLFDAQVACAEEDPESINLDDKVVQQLSGYITTVAQLYRDNPFHSYEHATHVTMSTVKLLSRIVAPTHFASPGVIRENAASLHDHTYGITSDPLTQFAVVFSALIHDMDHPGVANSTLVKEGSPLAKVYKGVSVAEQNSVDLAWEILMDAKYLDLRRTIYTTKAEFKRFRQLVVNAVMATDVMDKEIGEARKVRWNKAFSSGSEAALQESPQVATNRKATIVLEHLIQASDVAHTMQHWHIYQKWNQRLFKEMYLAYKNGRADKNPAEFWFEGEKGFLDYYIIPLAKKLKTCGVFGVSSDEFLNYATQNRQEWIKKGEALVAEMIEKIEKETKSDESAAALSNNHQEGVESFHV